VVVEPDLGHLRVISASPVPGLQSTQLNLNPVPVVGWYTSQPAMSEICASDALILISKFPLNFANTTYHKQVSKPGTRRHYLPPPRRWSARLRTFHHPLCSISSPRVTARALITVERSNSSTIHRSVIVELKNQTLRAPVQGSKHSSNPSSPPAKPYLSNFSNSAKLDHLAVGGPSSPPGCPLPDDTQPSRGLPGTCVLRRCFLPRLSHPPAILDPYIYLFYAVIAELGLLSLL
jgi:hypothetical protein